tara:strand:- start:33 stop:716 length:684 start_codon:yes stop_codon:yes gene_type:complete
MRKYFLLIFSVFVFTLLLFVVLKKEHLEHINLKDLLIYYQNYKVYIDNNKFVFIIIYLFFSTLWICLFGIMIPMLILSTLMFEYLAFLLSTISFSIGSTISYLLAKKFKKFIGNRFEKITITDNSFFLYIIFRFIPGVPYIIKNISGIFFKLQNREFFLATIIADTPQIFLIVFLIKRLIDSSESFADNLDLMLISEHLFLPALLIVLFLIVVFLVQKKFEKYFYKK